MQEKASGWTLYLILSIALYWSKAEPIKYMHSYKVERQFRNSESPLTPVQQVHHGDSSMHVDELFTWFWA